MNPKIIIVTRNIKDHVNDIVNLSKTTKKMAYRYIVNFDRICIKLLANKPNNILVVKYDDLKNTPEQVLRIIYVFLEIDFEKI
jgi:hypothetical protein